MNEDYTQSWYDRIREDSQAEREAIVYAALGQVRKTGLVQPLLSLVENADHLITRMAIDALLELIPQLEEDQLASIAKSSDSKVREAAYSTLVQVASSGSISHVCKGLYHDDPEIRKSCVAALESTKSPDAIDGLVQALQDHDMSVAAAAAAALGEIGGERTVEPLIAVLNVAAIGGAVNAALDFIFKNATTAERQPIEKIVALANFVRVAAIVSLGQIGDKRAVKPLLALLKDDDELISVVAIEALGSIGSMEAVVPLCERLPEADLESRKSILQALIDMESREALPFLRDYSQTATLAFRIALNKTIKAIEAASPGLTKLPRTSQAYLVTTKRLPRANSHTVETGSRPRTDE